MVDSLVIAKDRQGADIALLPSMCNRHGLIAGATGTGKTVTLQKMAEAFSRSGVPVFMADVKGDLTGIAQEGEASEKLQQRLKSIGVDDWQPCVNPVTLWDVYGEGGLPVRATISDLGPLLLSRLLDLNDTQSGVLQLVFKIADDQGLLLLDLKDLRAMLQFTADNARSLQTSYGNINSASVGAIQRGLLTLEQQGGDLFFGEPMLDVTDLMSTDDLGHGIVNILAVEKLYQNSRLYATVLLWLLSELFEQLPEAGDLEKPRLVFFFDEAHLLFTGAPKVLLEKVEQVVRLIRSKGVGVFFVSQNPSDIPDAVLGQLGNRVQHALRGFTPKDQKAIRAAAQTMRANLDFTTEQAITELGTGEALLSFLDARGSPTTVQIGSVIAPGSRMGPLAVNERDVLLQASSLRERYVYSIDQESAYERLQGAAQQSQPKAEGKQASMSPKASDSSAASGSGLMNDISELLFGSVGPRGGRKDGLVQTAAKTATRQIIRGLLGSITGKRR